ncbi:TonB-dependent receptor plug domain-containing protein [Tellurirhabdus rosea]|uniref:TonB-dependent receptor plug domain-containing protein n=1 Tax=Tellurirhabdus rosea TaxID=2674997 RepID=UPI0022519763|nr:TonB-dependent receptor plug domain-containing protein [Tellurirhabdus rosea]
MKITLPLFFLFAASQATLAQQPDSLSVPASSFRPGSVVTLPDSMLVRQPVSNPATLLQGTVAGVYVIGNHQPGGLPMVRIRGFRSVTRDNGPIFTLNGMPLLGSDPAIVPVDALQSVSVLKDPAASWRFSAYGNNGVVELSTRQTARPGLHVSAHSYAGISIFSGRRPELLNATEWATLAFSMMRESPYYNNGDYEVRYRELLGNGPSLVIPDYVVPMGAMQGDPRTGLDRYSNNPDDPAFNKTAFKITAANKAGTDWFGAILRNGRVQQHYVNVGYGSKHWKTYAAAHSFEQQGILRFTGYERNGLLFNNDFSFWHNRLRLSQQGLLTKSIRSGLTENNGSENSSVVFQALRALPLFPVYDVAGNYSQAGPYLMPFSNPVYMLARQQDRRLNQTDFAGSLSLELDLLSSLTFRASYGQQRQKTRLNWQAPHGWEVSDPAKPYYAEDTKAEASPRRLAAELNYSLKRKTLTGEVTLGAELFRLQTAESSQTQRLDLGDPISFAGSYSTDALFSSYLHLRLSDRRWAAEASLRRLSLSQFPIDNRSGLLPTLSTVFALRPDLRIRASWGQQTAAYTLGTLTNPMLAPYSSGAQEITFGDKPERVRTLSAGVDYQPGSRLTLSAEAFQAVTRNLTERTTVFWPGNPQTIALSDGRMRNVGLELSAGYQLPVLGNGVLTLNGQVSGYRNRRTHSEYFSRTIGQFDNKPMGALFGNQTDGLIQNAQEAQQATALSRMPVAPGQLRLVDVNNDGQLNLDDRIYIGNPHPDFFFGLQSNLRYRAFEVTIQFQGVVGNNLYDQSRVYTDLMIGYSNGSRRVLSAWSPTNSGSTVPRPSAGYNYYYAPPMSYFVESGSYLQLRDVRVAYRLPKLSFVQFYVQGQNLFYLTRYLGLTPEVRPAQDEQLGRDGGVYPTARTIVAGLRFDW